MRKIHHNYDFSLLLLLLFLLLFILLRALLLTASADSVRADNTLLSKVSQNPAQWHLRCFFFSIQVTVSKSLLSPVTLFFMHVLLSSQSQLLQYTSQNQLILLLMHLQLTITFFMPLIFKISSLLLLLLLLLSLSLKALNQIRRYWHIKNFKSFYKSLF